MQWQGPFRITEKINLYDYKIKIRGKTKIFHGNMLKKCYRRQVKSEWRRISASQVISCISVIETEETGDVEIESRMERIISNKKEVSVHFPVLLAKESVQYVKVNAELNSEQSQEV